MNGTVVLVAGGAGYIGSHACKTLAMKGYRPVVVDNLSRGYAWAVKWGPLEKISIGDQDALKAVFRKYQPAAVMHFAAFAYVGESVGNPALYYRNNIAESISLLSVMADVGCRRIIFSSTCSIYGVPEIVPIPESHPRVPINPYGRSKYVVECALDDFEMAYGLRSVSLRYFNAAGSDPDTEIGEVHVPETHIIPLALEAAANPSREFAVFGTDYDTPDGTCIRDYIHVTDLAEAHVQALEYLDGGGQSVKLNLGTGAGVSVLEVLATVREVTGKPLTVRHEGRRAGDPPELVADAFQARKVLGWEPAYADVRTQVSHAWQWLNRPRDD